MKQKQFINIHKGITGLFILLLMAVYSQWQNPTAWIYLALHGSYGVLWVLKSKWFPDKTWEKPTGWGYGLVIWGSLSLYWVAPWLLMRNNVLAPGWVLAICVTLFAFGTFFHFASDMQKYIQLKLQPERLITDGLFERNRNMNYFGELLIYSSFALLSLHWVPIGILLLWVLAYWLPNMRRKDRSLSRYPNFTTYKAKSKLFIPFLF